MELVEALDDVCCCCSLGGKCRGNLSDSKSGTLYRLFSSENLSCENHLG